MNGDQLFILALVGVLLPTVLQVYSRWLDRKDADLKFERARKERAEVAAAAKEAVELAKSAAETAAKARSAMAQEKTLEGTKTEILAAVKMGTDASASAEKVANHSNEKIEQLQKVLTTALNLPEVPMTERSIGPKNS